LQQLKPLGWSLKMPAQAIVQQLGCIYSSRTKKVPFPHFSALHPTLFAGKSRKNLCWLKGEGEKKNHRSFFIEMVGLSI